MSEIVPTNQAPAGALSERMQYAKALAVSNLLPKSYVNQPANVLVAIEYGNALGLAPMVAIQSIHVVEGKPTASAQLIGSLVRRAGHRLRVSGDATHAVAEIVRADDPDFVFRSEWNLDRARSANLLGKGVWKQYPDAMLKARAITEVARDACPEVLAGVAYTPEELGANDTGATWTVEPATPTAPAPTRPEATVTPLPAHDVETGEIIEDGEIVEAEVLDFPATPAANRRVNSQGYVAASAKQVNAVIAVGHSCGIDNTALLLQTLSHLLGRLITDLDDLAAADIDHILRDKGDGLVKARLEAMGLEVTAASDDPWAGTPAEKPAGEGITKPQEAKLNASFRALGITTPDDRRDLCRAVVNRPINTAADLTKREASAVIDHLTNLMGDNA